MPNVIENRCTVVGPAGSVQAFIADAEGPMPQFPREPYEVPTPPKDSVFSWHRLIPLPADVLLRRYGCDHGAAGNGHDWERALWGIKWGAAQATRTIQSPGRVLYAYRTPWSPGDLFFRRVSILRPTLQFFVSWGGEGPARGRFVAQNDVVTEVYDPLDKNAWHAANPVPPKGHESDEALEAYFDKEHAWREALVNTHDQWVSLCLRGTP